MKKYLSLCKHTTAVTRSSFHIHTTAAIEVKRLCEIIVNVITVTSILFILKGYFLWDDYFQQGEKFVGVNEYRILPNNLEVH